MLRAPVRRVLRPILYSSRAFTKAARDHLIDVHPEVEDALRAHKPVVALETAIVTHGMPQPRNLDTACTLEAVVRKEGAVPATIGIVGGRVKIGLTAQELERLADVESNRNLVKISGRDLGPAIVLGHDGGTTCSATLVLAGMAGIEVLVITSK
jgi:pseudouridylate synthase / pseudouridine kinase